MEIAAIFDGDILSNINWAGQTAWKGMVSVDSRAVTNGGEMANSDWVHVSSDSNSVPNGGIFRQENTSDESSIWCNPSVLKLWDLVIEWQDFAMSWKISLIGNVILESWSETVGSY